MPAKYRLNTLLARLPRGARLAVGQIGYDCDSQLKELRVQYSNTHLIKRCHEGISAVALTKDAEPLGTQCEISLDSRPDLAQALVKDWLARSLAAKDLRVRRTGQLVEYISERPDSNILNDVLTPGFFFPEGVGRRIAANFDVRRIREASGQIWLAVCIDVRTRVTLDCPLPTLLGVGLDVVGLYVQREVDTAFGRRRRLAGRVEAVMGDTLVLTDHDEGVPELNVADAWLEPRKENFDRAVKAVAGSHAPNSLKAFGYGSPSA